RFKIIVAGDTGCGKTSLVLRFTKDIFVEAESTIGVAFALKDVHVPSNGIIRMQIWDFSGQPRFKTLLGPMCIGASGSILVYDASDVSIETFNALESWLDILRSNALTINKKGVAIPVPVVLVGTKHDLLPDKEQKNATSTTIRAFMRKHGIALHHVVSGKTGAGVAAMFASFALHVESRLAGKDGDGNE
nr:Rab family GTPase [Candidatus Sigynarchaeota archaeon]